MKISAVSTTHIMHLSYVCLTCVCLWFAECNLLGSSVLKCTALVMCRMKKMKRKKTKKMERYVDEAVVSWLHFYNWIMPGNKNVALLYQIG